VKRTRASQNHLGNREVSIKGVMEKLKTKRERGKGEHPFEETNSRFRLYFPLTLSIRFRDLKEKKR
jgi:hypothetical protein